MTDLYHCPDNTPMCTRCGENECVWLDAVRGERISVLKISDGSGYYHTLCISCVDEESSPETTHLLPPGFTKEDWDQIRGALQKIISDLTVSVISSGEYGLEPEITEFRQKRSLAIATHRKIQTIMEEL
jgi:hypothetical protein